MRFHSPYEAAAWSVPGGLSRPAGEIDDQDDGRQTRSPPPSPDRS